VKFSNKVRIILI